MKYLKMLGTSMVAAVVALAIANVGSASATVFCSAQETPNCAAFNKWPANQILDFTLKAGTKAKFAETGGGVLSECNMSTLKWKMTNAGNGVETVTGPVEVLNAGGCTVPTAILRRGKLEVHNIANTYNGTVTVDEEVAWEINTLFFGLCIYGAAAGTDLGTLTEGNPAGLDVNVVLGKLAGSEIVCPATIRWTAEYTLTEPKGTTLAVQPS